MVRGFQKVAPGQPYTGFPAHVYNAMIDVINAHKRGQLTNLGHGVDTIRTSGIVHVENNSGSTRARMSVMGISESLILPTDDLPEWQDRVRLKVVDPTDSHVPDLFAILREPIDTATVGLATVSGVCQASVNVSDPGHGFAGCEASNYSSLISRAIGGARILWKETGTGLKNAIIRIGPPPQVGVVEINETSCEETERDASLCLWPGSLLECDTTGALCDPWTATDNIWVFETNVCDTQGVKAFTKIRGGERYVAIRLGLYDNAGDERPLYVIRNPDIGKVRVNKDDTLAFLEDQYRDHVAAGTYISGDLLVVSQTDDVGGDKLVRRFVDVTGYSSNEQVLTHPAGSSTPAWVDLTSVTVITDLQIYNNEIQKRTKTGKMIDVSDDGWSTGLPATEC